VTYFTACGRKYNYYYFVYLLFIHLFVLFSVLFGFQFIYSVYLFLIFLAVSSQWLGPPCDIDTMMCWFNGGNPGAASGQYNLNTGIPSLPNYNRLVSKQQHYFFSMLC
jgi:hypothetical protein